MSRKVKQVLLSFAVLVVGYFTTGLAIQWPLSDPDRLNGPVKSVLWELDTVNDKNETVSAVGDGYLVKSAQYDVRGKQVQATIGTNVCVDRCATITRYLGILFWPLPITWPGTRSYDSDGKLIQVEGGYQYEGRSRKWIERYEYDSHGNWIKKTWSLRDPVSFEGDTSFVPRQIEYRTIDYFP